MNVTRLTNRPARSRVALVALLSLAITGSGALPFAVAANSGLLSGNAAAWLDLAAHFAPVARLTRALDGSEAISYGGDGRLTFLLLGSDFRTWKPGNGERTDMIMVLTINPNTGKMAAASIPRDIARVPLPNGSTYKGRINSIVKYYTKLYGSRAKGLDQFRKIVAYVLGVEIDYVAILRFSGFDALMDELGSIRVTTRPAKDPKLQDADPVGVYFPSATNYELYGTGTKCRGWWRFGANTGQSGYLCHRALMYARTRKGAANSDFKRQVRGVDIVLAAIKKAASSGYGSAKLGSFVSKGQNQGVSFYSSLPMTLANAADLYTILKKANTTTLNRVVFKPKTYAEHIPGTATYKLKLKVVRNWIKAYFKNI